MLVCANRDDPMRRVRAIRPRMEEAGFELLCGKWPAQREIAARLGHDLTGGAWVSVPSPKFWSFGELTREAWRRSCAQPEFERGRWGDLERGTKALGDRGCEPHRHRVTNLLSDPNLGPAPLEPLGEAL